MMSTPDPVERLQQCIDTFEAPIASELNTALNDVRAHFAQQETETKRMGESQADAIVHSAVIITELEETKERLEQYRREAEVAIHESRLLSAFGEILDHSLNEIYIFSTQSLCFVHVNHGAQDNIGYTMKELRKMTPLDIRPEHTSVSFAKMVAPLIDGQVSNIEFTTVHRRKDGSQYPVRVHLETSLLDELPVFVAIILDVTEQERMLKQLHELAFHDSLTGLPNRSSILRSIQDAIDCRNGSCFALLYLDFDRFKLINDSLGHDMGDEMLKQISHRLDSGLRDTDEIVAARLGGDEFVVLLNKLSNPEGAIAVAERLLHVFSQSYELGNHTVHSSASIGVVVSDHRYESASEVLRDADLAMYEAKAAGKACYAVFDQVLGQKAQSRLRIECELRDAIEQEQFTLLYQPIVSLESGELEGVEALIRWLHPQRGMIDPNEFISVAEETGLILPIGDWVLGKALRQFEIWRQTLGSDAPATIHVNISRMQLLLPNFVGNVERWLANHSITPECLHLEVTESMIMHDRKAAIAVMTQLRDLGVKIDMDDFGTGHSSLSCLHEFPIDVLKIDRSFFSAVQHVRDFAALLHAVLSLADNLGLQVVSEGIEDAEQLATLQALGCQYGQGYHFSKPLPAEDIIHYILPQNNRTAGPSTPVMTCEPTIPPIAQTDPIQLGAVDA